jgi:hypothetical protein
LRRLPFSIHFAIRPRSIVRGRRSIAFTFSTSRAHRCSRRCGDLAKPCRQCPPVLSERASAPALTIADLGEFGADTYAAALDEWLPRVAPLVGIGIEVERPWPRLTPTACRD